MTQKLLYTKMELSSLASLITSLDEATPFPILGPSRAVLNLYRTNSLVNFIRRKRDYIRGFVTSRLFWNDQKKLHLGCGSVSIDGAINSDIIKSEAADYVWDAGNLPLPDNSIQKIETYHMVEHIPRTELPDLLDEWARVLIPDGIVVIEVPDFDATIEEYLSTEMTRREVELLSAVYGAQRFEEDIHRWGWSFERLSSILEETGFENVRREEPQDDQSTPCMRVEANV